MKIVCIEMPIADEVRANSAKNKEEMVRKGREDFPRLINFINSEIDKASKKGLNGISFNLDDDWFVTHDSRIEFTLSGEFTYELAKKLEEIYKELGFNCRAETYTVCNPWCYRTGSIKIHW